MNVLTFSLAVCRTSIVAGLLGALTGLGGGMVIVPVLCLLFKTDLHYAIGASLVSVIATSSGAAAYVREGYSNIRIGMFLEMATTAGALLGAYLTAKVSARWIGMIFGMVLLYSALLIATPIFRVIAGVVGSSMQRDRFYAPVSLIVLTILLTSPFTGR